MGPQERPPEEVIYAALDDLGRKLDTVAGAIAAVAEGHTTVLDHVAGSEARRSHDSVEVSHRLEALERQVLHLGHGSVSTDVPDQRLDNEFDDLGRQLRGLASLVADVIAATEGLANRPVVTGDQFRKAASAMKDSVVSANRSRRERRGGSKGLDAG